MMSSTTSFYTLSLALLAATTSASPFLNTLTTRDTTTCATGLHIMIGGGCDMPCASDVAGYLSTTISNITTAFPGSDTYFVPYDNSLKQATVSTPLMIAAATQYFAQCPTTPVVFLGYSMGAIITMGTLCGGLPAANLQNVLAAIAYGDETWTYPQTYDYGTCKANAPKYTRSTAGCATYAPLLRSYCDAADPACCTGGTDENAHFTYPELYNADALAFIKSQYVAKYGSASASAAEAATATSVSVAGQKTALASVTGAGSATSTATTSVATSAAVTSAAASSSSSTISAAMTTITAASSTTSSTASTSSTLATSSTTQVVSYTGAAAGRALPTAVPAFVGAVAVAALMGL